MRRGSGRVSRRRTESVIQSFGDSGGRSRATPRTLGDMKLSPIPLTAAALWTVVVQGAVGNCRNMGKNNLQSAALVISGGTVERHD